MKRPIYMIILTTAVMGCRKPYNPPAITSPGSYLVVEGVINSGSDSTFIKLSRTVSLSTTVVNNPVLGATLTVEGDQNVTYPLTSAGKGNYVSAGLNLDNTHKYRLRIAVDGETYVSDFEPVLNSPPIDSVNWTTTSSALNVYVNAHDPQNIVKYYRWDAQETWMFHSNYESFFASNGDTVLARDPANEIYTCWGNDTSSSINIASTAKLSKSVIVANPIVSIASNSEKLGIEYSILVRQYALTADAYNFYLNLKKNTEQLGSIFDAQPSQINGNIHSLTNPAEPVIGYITVGKVVSQRIFIRNQQLPAWLPSLPYTNCIIDSLRFKLIVKPSGLIIYQEDEFFNYNNKAYHGPVYQLIPLTSIDTFIVARGKDSVEGHSGSTPQCVDCTLRGVNRQPSFWK